MAPDSNSYSFRNFDPAPKLILRPVIPIRLGGEESAWIRILNFAIHKVETVHSQNFFLEFHKILYNCNLHAGSHTELFSALFRFALLSPKIRFLNTY